MLTVDSLTQQVLLVLVQTPHSLHQLPLLTAAFVVHEVPGQDFLQLPDTERLDVIQAGQVGQRCPAARNRGLFGVPGLNRDTESLRKPRLRLGFENRTSK